MVRHRIKTFISQYSPRSCSVSECPGSGCSWFSWYPWCSGYISFLLLSPCSKRTLWGTVRGFYKRVPPCLSSWFYQWYSALPPSFYPSIHILLLQALLSIQAHLWVVFSFQLISLPLSTPTTKSDSIPSPGWCKHSDWKSMISLIFQQNFELFEFPVLDPIMSGLWAIVLVY